MTLWEIADVRPVDKYGHHTDHPNCQLDTSEDYIDYLPSDAKTEGTAMKYASAWNMTPWAVLDMDWITFNRMSLIHKATSLRKPQYTPSDYLMERTSRNYKARKRR